MRHIRPLLALYPVLLFAMACSSDGDRTPATSTTATAVAEPTATQAPAPTVTPIPTAPTPLPGVQRVPSTVWSIDAASGQRTVIFEDLDAIVHEPAFVDGAPEIAVTFRPHVVSRDVLRRRTSLSGTVIATQLQEEICDHNVVNGTNVLRIRDRDYGPGICHSVSENGRWLLFEKVARQVADPPGSNYLVPESEMWVMDLTTGVERKLQEGLIHCGGCDGRFGPAFSATGRYAYFSETGAPSRVWLADLEQGTSSEISSGQGRNELGREPNFSPVKDALVYLDTSGQLVVRDFATGTSTPLQVTGVSGRFDVTGNVVYAVEGHDRQSQLTHVFDSITGTPIAVLDGAPSGIPYWLSDRPSKVVAGGGSFIAALENVPGCNGTGIYRGALDNCVPAVGASISPDGRKIAFARRTDSTGQVQYSGGGSVSLAVYEILLYDVASKNTQIVASGAISSEQVPPVIVWNENSTHFIVRWPLFPGL